MRVPRASESTYRRFEAAIGPFMLVLSILFVPVFVLSYVAAIPPAWRSGLNSAQWVIWGLFVTEYVARLCLAPRKRRMIRSHLLDLVVIALPFLRIARALRATRAIARFGVALGGTAGLGRTIASARRLTRRKGPQYFLLLVTLMSAVCAIVILNLEADHPDANIRSIGDALWWAAATVSTVGYGDRYPVTPEGRGVAFVLMILGLGLFSVVTAKIAAFLVVEDEGEDDLRTRLDRIEALLRASRRTPSDEDQGDD